MNEGEMLTITANNKYSFKGKCNTILVDCPAFNPEDDVIYRDED